MKKAQYFRFVSCVISVILCCLAGAAFVDHKAAADEKNTLEDGTYTMQSFLRSASSDQASMGNAGIVQPIQVIVKNGTYTVRAECKALSTKLGKLNFTGYLAQMSYFPNWKTTSGKIEAPENETPIPINIESYFENKDKAPLIAVVGSTEDGAGNLTYGGQVWNKKLLHERYDSVLPAEPCHECNMTNWNCFLIPREMVDNLGIIDGFYEHAKADNDYSNRIINSGNKIFVAKRYIGICQRNSLKNTWRDTSLPLKRRIELVKRPNGLPIKSEIYYCKKFHGKSWPLWVAKRYVWIFTSALKK